MAVQSIKYELYSPRGENAGDKFSASVIAKVTMAAGDGIVTALNAPGLPAIGSSYDHFGETDPATLRSVGVHRVRKNTPSSSIVDLVLNYERQKPGEGSGGQTPGGGPAEDPAEVQFVLTPGYRYLTESIASAYFLWYEDAEGNEIPPTANSLTFAGKNPIMNTAGVPYLPPPEHEIAVPTLTLERYFRRWNNNFDDALLTVNDAPYTIIFPDGTGTIIYQRTFDYSELLLQGISATQRQFGDELWYWLRFEFWIGDWTRAFLSEGILERATGMSAGRTRKHILNDAGERIDSPVPLDIEGAPLAEDGTMVYLRWATRETYNFDLLDLMVR